MAEVGDVGTPAGWERQTDVTGAVSVALPTDWASVVRPELEDGRVTQLGAARTGIATDDLRGVTGLLFEPTWQSAFSVTVNHALAQDLAFEDQTLDEAVQSAEVWANRGMSGLFPEIGCTPEESLPYYGVGLRGSATRYTDCHDSERSALLVVAVDAERTVLVIAWFIMADASETSEVDAILGSLRVRPDWLI